MSKSHIDVANMPEGFQVLGLEVRKHKTGDSAVGRKLGVSDNAVRKRLKKTT